MDTPLYREKDQELNNNEFGNKFPPRLVKRNKKKKKKISIANYKRIYSNLSIISMGINDKRIENSVDSCKKERLLMAL